MSRAVTVVALCGVANLFIMMVIAIVAGMNENWVLGFSVVTAMFLQGGMIGGIAIIIEGRMDDQ